jgi:hypothetical protein
MAEHGEQRSWLRLQRLLSRYDGWPILHYGETETLSLRRLAQRQGASDAQLRRLKRRLVDVHARIRSHWRLPLSSYGLKSVAAWRGFQLEPVLVWMVRGLCSGGGNGWGKVRSVEAPVMVWPGFFSTTKTIAEPLGLWRNGS